MDKLKNFWPHVKQEAYSPHQVGYLLSPRPIAPIFVADLYERMDRSQM